MLGVLKTFDITKDVNCFFQSGIEILWLTISLPWRSKLGIKPWASHALDTCSDTELNPQLHFDLYSGLRVAIKYPVKEDNLTLE